MAKKRRNDPERWQIDAVEHYFTVVGGILVIATLVAVASGLSLQSSAVLWLVALPAALAIAIGLTVAFERARRRLPPGRLAVALHFASFALVVLGYTLLRALAWIDEGVAMVGTIPAILAPFVLAGSLVQAVEALKFKKDERQGARLVLSLFAVYVFVGVGVLIVQF